MPRTVNTWPLCWSHSWTVRGQACVGACVHMVSSTVCPLSQDQCVHIMLWTLYKALRLGLLVTNWWHIPLRLALLLPGPRWGTPLPDAALGPGNTSDRP